MSIQRDGGNTADLSGYCSCSDTVMLFYTPIYNISLTEIYMQLTYYITSHWTSTILDTTLHFNTKIQRKSPLEITFSKTTEKTPPFQFPTPTLLLHTPSTTTNHHRRAETHHHRATRRRARRKTRGQPRGLRVIPHTTGSLVLLLFLLRGNRTQVL
jgi:hypothetical protein